MLTKAGQDALPVGRANCARLPPEALPPKEDRGRQRREDLSRVRATGCWKRKPSHTLGAVGPPHCLMPAPRMAQG
jgi:hypothetical protein